VARPFSIATAEQVVVTAEAAVVWAQPISVDMAADFGDLSVQHATGALNLGVDLGMLTHTDGHYKVASPLCRFLTNPDQLVKAAVLRVLLESYEPFTVFRSRLAATQSASAAAGQAKAVLDLTAHREDVKETLLSLGTYSQAIESAGGGQYVVRDGQCGDSLAKLATAATVTAEAEIAIRAMIGPDTDAVCDRDSVLLPLANAMVCAHDEDGRGAVVNGGNAVESYLTALGQRSGTNLSDAHGINAKIGRLGQAHVLPAKLLFVGRYLGHVRNAADHGIDSDIQAAWSIAARTGTDYLRVACSFLRSARLIELGKPPSL